MRSWYPVFLSVLLVSCIGTDILDDAVEPVIIILNPVSEIEVGTTYVFMAEYRNMTGMPENVPLSWASSNHNVIEIDQQGNATAIREGLVEISVTGAGVSAIMMVEAGDMTSAPVTERMATLQTSSTYPLEGMVILTLEEGDMVMRFADDFRTTSALPGLYVYLSNNTTTTNNALEIGKVTAFSGAQQYIISDETDLMKYEYVLFFCKPFVVPVGHGRLNP